MAFDLKNVQVLASKYQGGLSQLMANKLFSSGTVLPLFFTFLSMAGCATQQPSDSESWRNSQTPVLKQRSEARWAALMKNDIDAVYVFQSPAYRAVVDLQQFKGKFGRVMEWRLASAENVRYDEPAVATVLVKVKYQIDLPGQRGERVETEKVILEKWVYSDRGWWYTTH